MFLFCESRPMKGKINSFKKSGAWKNETFADITVKVYYTKQVLEQSTNLIADVISYHLQK